MGHIYNNSLFPSPYWVWIACCVMSLKGSDLFIFGLTLLLGSVQLIEELVIVVALCLGLKGKFDGQFVLQYFLF